MGTPDPGAFWRALEQHRVVTMFCAPTAFRAIKREDPEGKYLEGRDLSAFRALYLAGERYDTEPIERCERRDHCRLGGTRSPLF